MTAKYITSQRIDSALLLGFTQKSHYKIFKSTKYTEENYE